MFHETDINMKFVTNLIIYYLIDRNTLTLIMMTWENIKNNSENLNIFTKNMGFSYGQELWPGFFETDN